MFSMSTNPEPVDTDGTAADLRAESPQVRAALSALGRLLGASLAGPPRDLNAFVSGRLRARADRIATVKADLVGADGPLVQCAVAGLLDAAPSALLVDATGYRAPGYDLIATDVDAQVAAPYDLAAYLPAAEGLGIEAVLVVTTVKSRLQISLRVRREDIERARTELTALVNRARGPENFLRGKTLRAAAPEWELVLTPVVREQADRSEVLHSAAVWSAIDANIGGLARHGAALATAGLGAARGVLIAGAPGVGKTACAGSSPPSCPAARRSCWSTAR
jgi:hypothetical protein